MFDLDALLSLSIVALGILAWAGIIRFIGGGDPVDLAALFGRPWELAWPRGVQEEEPAHWRLDRLARSPALAATSPSAGADDCGCEQAAA